MVWNKAAQLNKPNERKDLAYFLAYLCLKNETIA